MTRLTPKLNLVNPSRTTLQAFAGKVAELAVQHHIEGGVKRPTGKEICPMFASDWRRGHAMMAARIYGAVIWSLKAADAEKETE